MKVYEMYWTCTKEKRREEKVNQKITCNAIGWEWEWRTEGRNAVKAITHDDGSKICDDEIN